MVGITYVDRDYLQIARSLANRRGFFLSSIKNAEIRFWLVVGSKGISLEDTTRKIGALSINFLSGTNLHRLRHSVGQREYLLRAIGQHKQNASIVDATAGLAGDGFMLAARGFKVVLIEQNLAIATLLEDALNRAYHDPEQGQRLRKNLNLKIGRAQAILDDMHRKPDLIYLDPMYPKSNKSSLPTKSMQYLREIITPDAQSDLLVNALNNAQKRVVVKRPMTATYLQGMHPSHQVFGKTTRYDVYVI